MGWLLLLQALCSTQTRETAEDKGQAGTCSQSESQGAFVIADGEALISCDRRGADDAQTE